MCCMVACGDCESWDNSEEIYSIRNPLKRVLLVYHYREYGICRHLKFKQYDPNQNEVDNLVYQESDNWNWMDGIMTGKDFGCIHGVKKKSQ